MQNVVPDGSCFFYALYHVARERGLLAEVANCFVNPDGSSCLDAIHGLPQTPSHVGLRGDVMRAQEQCVVFTMCVRAWLSRRLSSMSRVNRVDEIYDQLKEQERTQTQTDRRARAQRFNETAVQREQREDLLLMGGLEMFFDSVPVSAQKEYEKGVSKAEFRRHYCALVLQRGSYVGQVEVDEIAEHLQNCASILLRPNSVRDRRRLIGPRPDKRLIATYASSQPLELFVISSGDHFWYVRDTHFTPTRAEAHTMNERSSSDLNRREGNALNMRSMRNALNSAGPSNRPAPPPAQQTRPSNQAIQEDRLVRRLLEEQRLSSLNKTNQPKTARTRSGIGREAEDIQKAMALSNQKTNAAWDSQTKHALNASREEARLSDAYQSGQNVYHDKAIRQSLWEAKKKKEKANAQAKKHADDLAMAIRLSNQPTPPSHFSMYPQFPNSKRGGARVGRRGAYSTTS